MQGLTAPERETVILFSDAGNMATITTAQRRIITKLRKNPAAQEVASEFVGTTESVTFTLPANLVSFRTKRRSGGPGQPYAVLSGDRGH